MYLNDNLWSKSYLLEFKKDSLVEEAFTFSVPPQSEEFTFPQRINQTKTFGGSVIDDYGNDIIQISLSGTTINQEIKLIYCSSKGYKYLSGEDEILYLQKLISTYGEVGKLKDKTITLYALSESSIPVKTRWWNVVITEFNYKRSKDNPLAYFYTIKFNAYNQTELKSNAKWIETLSDTLNDWQNKLNGFLETFESAYDFLKQGVSVFEAANVILGNINTAVSRVQNSIGKYFDLATTYISASEDLLENITNTGELVKQAGINIALRYPLEVYSETKNLLDQTKEFSDWFANFGESNWSQVGDILEQYNATTEEIKDIWSDDVSTMSISSANIVAETKYFIQQSVPLVIYTTDEETGNLQMQIVMSAGYNEISTTASDTWDSLAEKYFGNSNYAMTLASFNAAYDINEISAGGTILIPRLSLDDNRSDNLIFNLPTEKDNLGKDIQIDDSGDFAITNNDFINTTDRETLSQSINNRLNTDLGSRFKDVVYGIRSNIGGESAGNTYIIASIEETIKQDPRIKEIEDITYSGNGNSLDVTVTYTDINGQSQFFGGTF